MQLTPSKADVIQQLTLFNAFRSCLKDKKICEISKTRKKLCIKFNPPFIIKKVQATEDRVGKNPGFLEKTQPRGGFSGFFK